MAVAGCPRDRFSTMASDRHGEFGFSGHFLGADGGGLVGSVPSASLQARPVVGRRPTGPYTHNPTSL